MSKEVTGILFIVLSAIYSSWLFIQKPEASNRVLLVYHPWDLLIAFLLLFMGYGLLIWGVNKRR